MTMYCFKNCYIYLFQYGIRLELYKPQNMDKFMANVISSHHISTMSVWIIGNNSI